jgi:phosphoribosylamine--glycine ligase
MASILLISKEGDGIPVALRFAQEGHIVKFWVKDDKAKPSLKGFMNPSQIKDPRVMLEQYDLVIGDMVGLGSYFDDFRSKGKLIFGGGTFNDKLELDRDYGIKVARSLLKVDVPDSTLIDDVNEAVDYVAKAKCEQVLKPLGNKATSLTLVSRDEKNRTLISYLKNIGQQLMPCVIQDRVDGIEISTEGFFNGKEFVTPFNHTFERKRFMEGDKGCNTGCMGNVVFTTQGNPITESVLMPLSPLLTKMKYVGPIDVNAIFTKDKGYFIEFTTRYGYDAIQAFSELIKGSFFDFHYKIATRSVTNFDTFDKEFGLAVRLSLPPWPSSDDRVTKLKGIRVVDIPKPAQKHVWLSDVMLDGDGNLSMAGVDGVIGCVTARGETIRECKRRVYRTVNSISLHNDIQYRMDIADGVEDKINKLTEWGWLNAIS